MNVWHSLRGQLALVFAAVFGLVTLLAGGYQYQQVGQVLHQGDDHRLRARAATLLERMALDPLPTLLLPGPGERMRVVVQAPGQAAHELFHSPGFGGVGTPEAPAAGWRVAELNTSLPDATGQTNQVRLWLAHSAAPLAADLGRVRRGLALGLVGSLALAAALAWVLGEWALRPLRRISRQARRIGAAPGDERLPVPATGDEVQELAQTLNQMLDRLAAGAKLQDNFLAAAAHELRTPLAVVQAGLGVVQQASDLPAHLRPVLATQLEEMHRLGRLVDDFLLVSRLRADTLPLARRPVALDELALAAADCLLPRFRAVARPLELRIEEQVADFLVLGDADKLTTVMLNLLENALRHAPPGSTVRLHVGREAATGWPYAEVTNPLRQSLGDLSRLTAAHYQADVLSEGAGLGLWISNRIAELHGAPLALRESAAGFAARLRLPPGGPGGPRQ